MSDDQVKPCLTVPRPAMVLHGGASTFTEECGSAVLLTVPFPAQKSALWIAEALNEALVNYLVSFAIDHPSTPSKQARWNEKLRSSADECLETIAPGFSLAYPPGRPHPDVYSALFHNGTPDGIKRAHLKWLGFDDEWQALDRITDALWLLRSFAENAETRWREQMAAKDMDRRSVRRGLLTWVSDLGVLYAQVFGRLPSYSTRGAPFARFAEAARLQVLDVQEEITGNGTDPDAYAELRQFDGGRLVSFAKRHREIVRPRWQQGLSTSREPDRFRLGIVAENAPADDTGH